MEVFPKALEAAGLRHAGPAPVSPFDEARATLDAWEKEDPHAAHVVMVLDGTEDIVVALAGAAAKPSSIAGLLFNAATLMVAE